MSATLWEGLIGSLESCEENDNVPMNIKILKNKLSFLESSKNLSDIQHSLHFTKEERNYLNSPLLDEIFETIFTDYPIRKALKEKKNKAVQFYHKRCTVPLEILMSFSIEYNNIEAVKYFLSFEPTPNTWNFSKLLEKVYTNHEIDIEIIRLFIQKGGRLELNFFENNVMDALGVKLILELGLLSQYELLKKIDLHHSYVCADRAISAFLEYVNDISENDYYIVKEVCKFHLHFFYLFKKYNFKESDPVIQYLKNKFHPEKFNYVRPYLVKE